ncbi:MAG TPA: 7-cyano-7-deazaguanine synthase, partial [Elusimicrobiota bacterium]|nr:7-cyano-7-deazaguanine synthase [Elusimicrobiota bacterium]
MKGPATLRPPLHAPPRAVVLLSGGLDSSTALYWALRIKRWNCRAIAFDYGQRHRRELRSARSL